MNKTERMWKIYGDVREQEGRREGREEGELRGKVLTIEALLGRDAPGPPSKPRPESTRPRSAGSSASSRPPTEAAPTSPN